MDNIFLQISVLLGIAVSVAFIMRFFKQPLVVAYIVAGLIAGPMALNIMHGDKEMYQSFAQFGVVLLLFVVGLNLNLSHIKNIGKVVIVAGIGQVLFTASIGCLILLGLNFPLLSAFYLAVAITFSSTIIIVKLLSDKKDTQALYGRYTIGLMIIQDIIAIIILIIINSIGVEKSVGSAIILFIFKLIVLTGFIIVLARYVLPGILNKVAQSGEFLFIFTIAWCFAVASLLYWAGFGIEIGAIVAGLSLGASSYQAEISSRIKPLRDFFLVIFFIILGSELQITNVDNIFIPAMILTLFIILGNTLILYIIFRLFKFTRRNSFLAGVTAAQVSEFGFVLLFAGQQGGHILGNELSIFILVALGTICLSTYIITYNEQIFRFLLPMFNIFGHDKYRQSNRQLKKVDVWVFGYHRIGWKVCEALAEKKIKFAVVDFDPASISKLKHRGIPAYFGDAADVEFLEELPLEKAKLIISTLPEADDQKTLITHIRQRNKKIHIIANLYHSDHLDELYQSGADYVMMPHLLGGQWIANVLKEHKWNKTTFRKIKEAQKEEMQLRFTAKTHI